MHQKRLSRLQAELQAQQIDCLALMPGANLTYMTGQGFHLMERPTVGFIPAEGKPVFAIPSLEASKFDHYSPFEHALYPYTDEDGPADAYKQAIMALPEIHTLAVEFLSMRVLELRLIQRHAPNAVLTDANPVMDVLRQRKDEAEVEAMRGAIRISEAALKKTIAQVQPGMSEKQIASILSIAQMEGGGGVVPFQPIVLAGARAALPHGAPSEAVVNSGDVLLIDFGTRKDGYVSDITRTFAVGKPLEGMHLEVYEAVKAANAAGRTAAGPGVPCQEVDRAARKVIDEAGFGEYFIHRVGHGIGMEGHEHPYMVEGNETPLEVGMAFTVEPGIYIPGEIGVRIEDDMVVTPDGAESLTTFDRELMTIGQE